MEQGKLWDDNLGETKTIFFHFERFLEKMVISLGHIVMEGSLGEDPPNGDSMQKTTNSFKLATTNGTDSIFVGDLTLVDNALA